jgi:putative ABC transport system permease protein
MKLGLKDIRFAKGRFALMAGVVALITMLLVMLTGLTSGLGNQSISAVRDLPVDRVVFSTGDSASGDAKPDFTSSQITAQQLAAYQDVYGDGATPLGLTSARAQGVATDGSGTSGTANVAVFAAQQPEALSGAGSALPKGSVFLDEDTASSLGLLNGSALTADAKATINGKELAVAGLVDAQWYSHMPVAWMSIDDWASIAHTSSDVVGTVMLLADGSLASTSGEVPSTLTDDSLTTAVTPGAAVRGLPSYTSENGSLALMQAFLYGISGLVIAAFVAVWTVQRTRDIAVLKALGASGGYVVRDALSQSLVVTVLGAVVGGALGGGIAVAASAVVPIHLTLLSAVLPIAGIIVIGLAASMAAVKQTTSIDPLLALGGN